METDWPCAATKTFSRLIISVPQKSSMRQKARKRYNAVPLTARDLWRLGLARPEFTVEIARPVSARRPCR
jgi:hypothetical protein